jgi:hypothetical protein
MQHKPILREDEVPGTCSTHGETKSQSKTVVGKPEGKRSFGRHWYRWEDNIKTDFKEIACEGVD